ncbi:hypothetical protein GCK32_020004 [Trichostrongylus colubriformis]|uniref:Uncharacterized protein n=1 Tax=Trichostrongylus colubriformis TaxID=6319 RepID=A0AAN8IWJ3_TRICO
MVMIAVDRDLRDEIRHWYTEGNLGDLWPRYVSNTYPEIILCIYIHNHHIKGRYEASEDAGPQERSDSSQI